MRSESNSINVYVISVLVLIFVLTFVLSYVKVEPTSFFGRVYDFLHSPVVLGLLGVLLLISLLSLKSQAKREQTEKKEIEQSSKEQTDMLIRPIRLYELSSLTDFSSIVDLSSISDQIMRISRRGDAGVVDLLDYIISMAIKSRASDIHIEPTFDNVLIKYRMDGVLHDVGAFHKNLLPRFISRLRVLSNLTIFQRGKPQDGRIDVKAGKKSYDIRLSILPTLHGEKAVIRLFESGDHGFLLNKLGMSDEVLENFSDLLLKPQGTIFLTGPTGSGKTTTIYAAIRHILENRGDVTNIVTIEDPIECEITGINQTQVNPKRDLTFASGLRSILRQDPDVIMVGEVRDRETAQICTQAGLTGHLIISSIHADSSVGVFNRLIDMGIEPFLVASSISGIMAQRLVRKNCPHCSEPAMPSLKSLRALGISVNEKYQYMKGVGCPACQNRGYLGRIGIFELLVVEQELREALQQKVSTSQLYQIARRSGLIPMKIDGIEKVKSGIIDLDELARVIG